MPEGHKTHFLAAEHRKLLAGQTLKVTSPQGRFTTDARKVTQRVLEDVRAIGKHMFYDFEGGRVVQVHLGRYGSFATQASPPQPPKGQVRMRLVAPETTIDLRGPTRCRLIDADLEAEIRDSLGPDPLAGGRKQDVWKAISASSKPIGGLLLDQSVIAGIGNIFRAEILFDIGLDPNRPGNELTKSDFDALWKSTLKMMRVSLKHGRIISVTAKEAGKPLSKLSEKERFRVYGVVDCTRCHHAIETTEIASRKLYFCPGCQS
ncbi:MAG: DNA-formamidopyrimidine glycosylase family protein [Planctomycetota bacterium]